MFDIGFAEILIVAVVALVVLGPEKLPGAIRTVGMWVRRIRSAVGSIQSEISEELRIDELKRTAAIQKSELDKELDEMRQPFNEAHESLTATKAPSVEELKEQANAEELKTSEQSKIEK